MKSALIVCMLVIVMCINTMVNTSRAGKIVMVTEKDQPKFLTDRDLFWLGLEKPGCPVDECACLLPGDKHGCCKCHHQEKNECECGKCTDQLNPENGAFCCPRCDCPCGIQHASGGTGSVPSEHGYECSPCDPQGNRCFPASASIKLETGKQIIVSELQVGDKVQTVSSEGRVRYSEVSTFLTKDDVTIGLYTSITTSLNKTINLSGNHIIYARKTNDDKFGPKYTNDVLTGDEVLVPHTDKLVPEKVIDISSSKMHGAYVPLTRDGNVVVDGVLASCYASFNHDLAHIAMVSIHWFPETMEWIFGVENGNPGYVKNAKEFDRLVLPHELLFTTNN